MSRYTKGPWRLRKSAKEAPDDLVVMDEQGASVADTRPSNPYMSIEEALANARLISAAPELLACCKDLLEDVNQYLGPCIAGGKMTAARAAIAKAEFST